MEVSEPEGLLCLLATYLLPCPRLQRSRYDIGPQFGIQCLRPIVKLHSECSIDCNGRSTPRVGKEVSHSFLRPLKTPINPAFVTARIYPVVFSSVLESKHPGGKNENCRFRWFLERDFITIQTACRRIYLVGTLNSERKGHFFSSLFRPEMQPICTHDQHDLF